MCGNADWLKRAASGPKTVLLVFVWFASILPLAAQERVRIGFSDSPPISSRDPSSGQIHGLAVSVFTEVAREAGLAIEPELLSFGDLIPSLTSGRVDVVTMSWTPQRGQVAAFSRPFARYGELLLVRAEDPGEYRDLAALRGKRVASNAGGGWIQAAQSAGATIITFPGAESSLKALQAGEVSAIIGNAPTYRFLLKTGAYPNVRVAESYVAQQTNELAFGVRKAEKERLGPIDAALQKMTSAGVLDKLRADWGF